MSEEFHIGDWVLYEDPETGETRGGIVTNENGDCGTVTPVLRIGTDKEFEPSLRDEEA